MSLELLTVGDDYVLTIILLALILARIINFYTSGSKVSATPAGAAVDFEIEKLKKEIASLSAENQFTQRALAQRKLLALEKSRGPAARTTQAAPSGRNIAGLASRNAGFLLVAALLWIIGFSTPVATIPSIISSLARFNAVLVPSAQVFPTRHLTALQFTIIAHIAVSAFMSSVAVLLTTGPGRVVRSAALARGSPLRAALIAVAPSALPADILRDEAIARGVSVSDIASGDFRKRTA